MVVVVLFNAGDHVPVIPLFDIVGNADKLAPEQIGETCVNVGFVVGVTLTTEAADVAEQPLLFVTTAV